MYICVFVVAIEVASYIKLVTFIFKRKPYIWRDSISRPIAPVSQVAGGDDTTN
jgi:hypothetical protein